VKITFSARAWDHYIFWLESDPQILAKINTLLEECRRNPFRGTGKPEPLGGNLTGWWSRRISGEQRLVYRMAGKGERQAVEVAQCRYHY